MLSCNRRCHLGGLTDRLLGTLLDTHGVDRRGADTELVAYLAVREVGEHDDLEGHVGSLGTHLFDGSEISYERPDLQYLSPTERPLDRGDTQRAESQFDPPPQLETDGTQPVTGRLGDPRPGVLTESGVSCGDVDRTRRSAVGFEQRMYRVYDVTRRRDVPALA